MSVLQGPQGLPSLEPRNTKLWGSRLWDYLFFYGFVRYLISSLNIP